MKINDLILAMIDFYQGHPKQIQHLIKVHSFARVIGIDEGLSTQEQERLEVAAIVHDIGINLLGKNIIVLMVSIKKS